MTELWTPPGPAPQPPWPGPDVTPFVPWDVAKDGGLVFMTRQGAGVPGSQLLFLFDGGFHPVTPQSAMHLSQFKTKWIHENFGRDLRNAKQFVQWLRAHCEYVVPF